MSKFNWKEWAPVAIVIYLLSLPIAFWRSSRIGKIIGIALMLVVIFWAAGKASDIYYGKFRYRAVLDEKMKPFQEKINSLQASLLATQTRLEDTDKEIQSRVDKASYDLQVELSKASDRLTQKLVDIDKAADLIKDSERAAMKEKIIQMREDVKINKKSIDSKEIRSQYESVADNFHLLTNDEKERFKKDLEEIGFEVEKIRNNSMVIYGNAWNGMTSTMSTVQSVYYDVRNGWVRDEQ